MGKLPDLTLRELLRSIGNSILHITTARDGPQGPDPRVELASVGLKQLPARKLCEWARLGNKLLISSGLHDPA
jgi:hypothetical protein